MKTASQSSSSFWSWRFEMPKGSGPMKCMPTPCYTSLSSLSTSLGISVPWNAHPSRFKRESHSLCLNNCPKTMYCDFEWTTDFSNENILCMYVQPVKVPTAVCHTVFLVVLQHH